MRTFNVRFAVILLATTFVFGAGIYFLHAYQVRRNADFFLDQADLAAERAQEAKKAKHQKEEEKAISEQLDYLQWYLQFKPEELKILEKWALLKAEYLPPLTRDNAALYGGQYNQVCWTLEKVLRQDENREESREKLVELWLMMGRFSDAEYHLTMYFLKKYPDNPKYLDLLGQCQQARGEERKAEAFYRKALEFGPKQVDTYWNLVRLLWKLKRQEDAAAVMEKMIEMNPDNSKALLYQVQYRLVTGETEKALEYAEKALALSPDDREGLLLAAQAALASKEKLDVARKYAQHGIEVYPEDVDFYSLLADVENRSKNPDKVLQALDQGLQKIENAPDLIWKKANFLVDNGHYEEAKKAIRPFEKQPQFQGYVEFIQARIHLASEQWREAVQGFEKSQATLKNKPGLLKLLYYWQGICYGKLGYLDKQLDAFDRAKEIDPFYEDAWWGRISALKSAGRYKEAQREYEGLMKFAKNRAQSLLPQISIKIIENLRLPKSQRNWEEVEKMLDDAAKEAPDSPDLIQYRCEVLADKGQFDAAEKFLQEKLEKYPKGSLLWNLRVGLGLRMRDWRKTEEVLLLWENECGDSVPLRLAKSRLYIPQYGESAGPYLHKLEENIQEFNDQEKLALYAGLINAYQRIGDQENLSRLVGLMAEKDPRNIRVQYLRMDQAYQRQDQATMEQALEDIKEIEGKGAFWHYGQALLLELHYREKKDQSLLEKALDQLAEAEKINAWSKIPLTRGAIYDELGNEKLALRNYLEAIQNGEYNSVAIRRVLQIYFGQQRFAEAEDLLRGMEQEQAPIAPEIVKMWAQLLIHQGEIDLAVKKARQAVKENNRNYQEQLWLGQILSMAATKAFNEGRREDGKEMVQEVEKAYRRAVELNEAAPESWVILVHFLCKSEKNAEAEKVLHQAQQKLSGVVADIAVAQCYEALNQYDQAKDHFEAARAAKPDDIGTLRIVADFYLRNGKMKEAEPLLKRVLEDQKLKADREEVNWARRNMAVIVMAPGGYDRLQEARKMIEQNLREMPDSIPDRRTLALIDLSDPLPERQKEGRKVFEQMRSERKASADDLFTLAKQYLNLGDWRNARELFLKLLTMGGSDPRYLSAYLAALLEHNEITDAALCLAALKKVAPLARETTQLEAEVLFHRGKPGEALQLLQAYVDQADALPANRSLRIFYAASTMDKLARKIPKTDRAVAEEYLRTAEMFYRQYVNDNPSQKTVLISFLSRQGRQEDALRILESSWADCDPILLASACLEVSGSGKGPQEIVNRVARLLHEAQAKYPSHPSILMALGDLNVGQGNFAEAEAFYRQVLEKNKGHSIAMNNLAVLLSVTHKKLDEALQLINQAIKISGPLPAMLDTRASVYLARKEPEKAQADIQRALEAETTADRLFHQALAFEMEGQKNAAAAVMVKALEKGLTPQMLLHPEVEAFTRLEKAAQAISPPKPPKKH